MTEESIAILVAHLQALDVNELGLFFFLFVCFYVFPLGPSASEPVQIGLINQLEFAFFAKCNIR